MPTSCLRWLTHHSQTLKDNPWNDPTERSFPVYLPVNYEQEKAKTYPVVFVLAGFLGASEKYLQGDFLKESYTEIIDQLIEQGMPEAIFVFPNCLTSLGGSQYLNSSAVGQYEDYLVQELVPFVETQVRSSGRRALVGNSSGGYGAFHLSMKHPQVFQGFCAHSADSAFEYSLLPEFPVALKYLAQFSGGVAEFLRKVQFIQPKDKAFIQTLNVVAMSACYAPEPTAEEGFQLPFDLTTGELTPEVWKQILAKDLTHLVDQYQEGLRSLTFIYFDCGERDQYHLHLGARRLHQKLQSWDISHQYEEFKGDHFLWTRERLKKSLPFLLKNL